MGRTMKTRLMDAIEKYAGEILATRTLPKTFFEVTQQAVLSLEQAREESVEQSMSDCGSNFGSEITKQLRMKCLVMYKPNGYYTFDFEAMPD